MSFAKRAVVVVGLVAAVLPARAQDYRPFQGEAAGLREQARWRIGPLLLFPSIRIQDVGYDDNVYLDGRGERIVADYRATVAPEVRANIVLGNSLILSFTDSPEYLYYAKERSRRAFGNSFAPGFRALVLKRFVLSGRYDYQKHFNQLSREVGILTENTSESYYGELFVETPRQSSLGISGEIRKYTHESLSLQGSSNTLARELDREEKSVNAELYYPLSPVRVLFLRAGYAEYAFSSAAAGWRDSSSWQASGGIRFSPAGRVQGMFLAGYKRLRARHGGRRSFSGVFSNTELNLRLGRFTLRGAYSRDPVFSYWSDVYFYVDDRISAGASLYLSQSLRFDYSFSRSRMDYPEPVPHHAAGGVVLIDRLDRENIHAAGLMIRVFRTTGIGISANYGDRTSSFPGISYRRLFIGGSLSHEF